jgi:hypothetical protein
VAERVANVIMSSSAGMLSVDNAPLSVSTTLAATDEQYPIVVITDDREVDVDIADASGDRGDYDGQHSSSDEESSEEDESDESDDDDDDDEDDDGTHSRHYHYDQTDEDALVAALGSEIGIFKSRPISGQSVFVSGEPTSEVEILLSCDVPSLQTVMKFLMSAHYSEDLRNGGAALHMRYGSVRNTHTHLSC